MNGKNNTKHGNTMTTNTKESGLEELIVDTLISDNGYEFLKETKRQKRISTGFCRLITESPTLIITAGSALYGLCSMKRRSAISHMR